MSLLLNYRRMYREKHGSEWIGTDADLRRIIDETSEASIHQEAMDAVRLDEMADVITLSLSRLAAETVLAAIVAYGYRTLRHARRNAPLSTGGRTVELCREASQLLGDALGAPDEKRFL